MEDPDRVNHRSGMYTVVLNLKTALSRLLTFRIDTCIVGDDTTCDESQHEVCRTESGVSACHCRPGTARKRHRDPCRKVVSVMLSMRVDRIYERKVIWADELSDKSSESYQQLSYEAERAVRHDN